MGAGRRRKRKREDREKRRKKVKKEKKNRSSFPKDSNNKDVSTRAHQAFLE